METEQENLNDQQKKIINMSIKMRAIQNRGDRERFYQDELVETYVHKYTALIKLMAEDYKRQAINAFITNSICGASDKKYSNKHKDLIEKALYGGTAWHKLRDRIYEKTEQDLKIIEKEMPFSIKKASKQLHEQFTRFLDVRDLDEKTEDNMGYM